MGRDRSRSRIIAAAAGALLLVTVAPTARADHTNPRTQLSPLTPPRPGEGETTGEGTWEFIANFPANPGTDLEIFTMNGQIFSSSGTLGQANEGHVGQRLIRLVDAAGKVDPQWFADHGSANCPTANPSGTLGLQHDVQAALTKNPKVLIDTTDATGRCHDPGGGGIEIIDMTKRHKKQVRPRELHLIRVQGTSHNATVDATRPWIVYNSSGDFSGRPWIDVFDIKTCLKAPTLRLKVKRAACRPVMYRINFKPEWARQRMPDGELLEGSEAACHDITVAPGRIYCAALNATLIFDVSGLTDPKTGAVRGRPFKCEVIDGTMTAAKVTDCNEIEGDAQAEGWVFLGTYNHPGRNNGGPPPEHTRGNTNLLVTSDEGVAVSHESDPSPDGKYMFVTDERGGGVLPPGASCSPGQPNPYGNGGMHVFDISDPSKMDYALKPDGSKAVYIGEIIVPSPSFCTIHVIEQIPGEARLAVAYYSQGTKIVDYFIDSKGRWSFRETATFIPANANAWASEVFKIVTNDDKTKTYYFVSSDIERGIDVFSWTGPPNPLGTPPPELTSSPEYAPLGTLAR